MIQIKRRTDMQSWRFKRIYFNSRTILLLIFLFADSSILTAQKLSKAEIKSNQIKALIPDKLNLAEKLSVQFMDEGIAKGDQEVIARSNYLLGLIHYYRSVFYISNKYYAAALQTKFANQNLKFKEACLNNMGINYEIQSMLPKAMTAYNESLKLARILKDSTGICELMINLGLLNAKAKKYDLALYNVNQALNYFERQNDKTNLALCYENLSFISTDFQRHEEAIVYSNKALELFISMKNKNKISACYYNLSVHYLQSNDPRMAKMYIQKAKAIIDKFDFKEVLATKIYIQEAEIQTVEEDYKEAESNLMTALHLCELSGANENTQVVYSSFLNLYAKSGDYEKYTIYKEKAIKEQTLNTQLQSYARVDELGELYKFQEMYHKVNHQEKEIKAKQNLITISIIVILGFIIVFVILLVMYIRMRNYSKSLFENIVENTTQDTLINESITDRQSRNKYLFSLFNQVLVFIKEQKHFEDITIQEISESLAADQNDIANAISLFGNKDFEAFLSNYYIDQICKKIIKKGRNISIQKLIDNSPFKNAKELEKKFKGITGLSVEQFIEFSEQKLIAERE